MRRLVFIVVCFLPLALVQSSANSSSLSAGDTIVFSSRTATGDVNPQLFVVNRDGSQRQQLTKNTVEDTLPAWSPNHTRIAFARKLAKSSIWVMSASGVRQHRLGLGTHPSWSPSGSQLAFDRGGVVYTMSDHGRKVRRITKGTRPVWAPRGRRIAFERGTKLFVINIDTKAVGLLADRDRGLACEQYGEGDPAIATLSSPEWSPDATKLLVSLSCDYYKSSYVKAMIVGLHGNGVTGNVPINSLAPGSRMAWSPDGSRLAFAIGPDSAHYYRIATAKLDGTDLTEVTSGVGWDQDPDW